MFSQVTHHSAIFPPSMRNTAPKSKCTFRPDGGNGPIEPCCVPSYVVYAATRFPSATRSLIVWTESGKNCRTVPEKFLYLIKTPSLDSRRCFAMADNIRPRCSTLGAIRSRRSPWGARASPPRRRPSAGCSPRRPPRGSPSACVRPAFPKLPQGGGRRTAQPL